jgi:hypothetical protein
MSLQNRVKTVLAGRYTQHRTELVDRRLLVPLGMYG